MTRILCKSRLGGKSGHFYVMYIDGPPCMASGEMALVFIPHQAVMHDKRAMYKIMTA